MKKGMGAILQAVAIERKERHMVAKYELRKNELYNSGYDTLYLNLTQA